MFFNVPAKVKKLVGYRAELDANVFLLEFFNQARVLN
jgi:hypothetical protein